MGMFTWFDAKSAQEFGEQLANALIERTPLEEMKSEKSLSKKHEAMLNKLNQMIVDFKKENTLNFYKKAKLGNRFRWVLIEKGYDQEYVDRMTNWLIIKL
jgi:hypothetical protein